MTEPVWAATLLWAAILVYAVGASFDFGSGFWGWWESRRGHRQGQWVAERYVSPLWEVTNVFLVLIPVALIGFFPAAAYAYGVLLLVPGSLILILLAIRGTFLVYGHTSQAQRRRTEVIAAWTGLLIPALLVLVLPVSQGLGVRGAPDRWRLDLAGLLFEPATYGFLGFGLTSELFLSALLLADFARVTGASSAYRRYRRRALILGPIMFALAAGVWALLPPSQIWMQTRLLQNWPWFAASFACFLGVGLCLRANSAAPPAPPGPQQPVAGGVSTKSPQKSPGPTPSGAIQGPLASWKNPTRWAVILAVFQYAFAHWGYGRAHLPYLLAPFLSVDSAFTDPAMFRTLLVVLLIGLAVFFPVFVWFWRFFMEDRNPATPPAGDGQAALDSPQD
ncbi:MAG: cytochrome d ubiquinol oxidase subunit II [Kyrpidia sp.]|nr:cytochrome d ubiquinol oxidase subunit II [Kyrpidia sp.]